MEIKEAILLLRNKAKIVFARAGDSKTLFYYTTKDIE